MFTVSCSTNERFLGMVKGTTDLIYTSWASHTSHVRWSDKVSVSVMSNCHDFFSKKSRTILRFFSKNLTILFRKHLRNISRFFFWKVYHKKYAKFFWRYFRDKKLKKFFRKIFRDVCDEWSVDFGTHNSAWVSMTNDDQSQVSGCRSINKQETCLTFSCDERFFAAQFTILFVICLWTDSVVPCINNFWFVSCADSFWTLPKTN